MNSRRLFFVHLAMGLIPATRMFWAKRALLRWAGARVGANVRIASSARFFLTGRLTIGRDTWIGHDFLLAGGASDVCIGSKVDIAPRVTFVSGTHELFTEEGRAAGAGYSRPITVGDGVWIGASATVLGGVQIKSCGVVGAGALVREDVVERTVVAGVPARLVQSAHLREE
jgi:acetyltransferase-like isoleucine patch superfamily enzyme